MHAHHFCNTVVVAMYTVIAFFEMVSISRMGKDSGDAWDTLAQDPKGSSGFKQKSAAEQSKLKLQEVKNGRLAMM
jgi:Chlorophyll A-B binding protein